MPCQYVKTKSASNTAVSFSVTGDVAYMWGPRSADSPAEDV